MNIVWLVVDSLRAQALGQVTRTPFFDTLARETVHFRRAYAAECWTLPSHVSMFTGLLPSEHQAHFRTMGYEGRAPTIADVLTHAGYDTEIVTRNSIFDGSIPGITRGFRKQTRLLSAVTRGLNPLAVMLAVSKPRFRRQILATGTFHALQRTSREFVTTFARATVPADELNLTYLLERMAECRRHNRPYFFFSNLYDVHAPYSPSRHSIFEALRSWGALTRNLHAALVLPRLGGHAYLRPGFRLSDAGRRLLLDRYHAAIQLMDGKLARFHHDARAAGLLDDTLLIVTSDHGEAFGDHGLYMHDSSVYDVHLHVPLYVHHPALPPAVIDDTVTTRDLFGLVRAVALGEGLDRTLLSSAYRDAHPAVVAEHFHYPLPGAHPRYLQDLIAVITGDRKLVVRREGPVQYDLGHDPCEQAPEPTTAAAFAGQMRRLASPASGWVETIQSAVHRVAH